MRNNDLRIIVMSYHRIYTGLYISTGCYCSLGSDKSAIFIQLVYICTSQNQ